MTVLIQHWSEPAKQGQMYILCRSITTTLRLSCYATSETDPVWRYRYDTEENLRYGVRNTSCAAVSLQHWGNPAMQHWKFILNDSIDTTLRQSYLTGWNMNPAPQGWYDPASMLQVKVKVDTVLRQDTLLLGSYHMDNFGTRAFNFTRVLLTIPRVL